MVWTVHQSMNVVKVPGILVGHGGCWIQMMGMLCHDFHGFSSFSFLSPRRSRSNHDMSSFFSFFILSYLSLPTLYLIFQVT